MCYFSRNLNQNIDQMEPSLARTVSKRTAFETISELSRTASLSTSSFGGITLAESINEDLGGETFMKEAEQLNRQEMLSCVQTLFSSLKQFRSLLAETNNIPTLDTVIISSELKYMKESTIYRIISRVKHLVSAEHCLFMLLDKVR